MQGAAPLASPRLSRRRHLQSQPNRFPAQRKAHSLPQKVTGVLFSEQCRQPRRGGTGGDGTIRRKRRRRLRWSSPPGQGEQVPLGFILPPSPRVPQRQGQPATRKARPPPGAWFAPLFPCRFRLSPGDARGEAPCIRKQKISPFPSGRGAGGWGKERKLKAGLTGDKEGKPPLRLLERQGQPATRKARPLAGRVVRPLHQCRLGSALGMQGAKPLA